MRRTVVFTVIVLLLAGWLGAAAGLMALGLAVAGWWVWSSRAPEVPTAPLEITPLTSDGGLQFWPQLTPDGEMVAYSWTGTADDNWDISVRRRGLVPRPSPLT